MWGPAMGALRFHNIALWTCGAGTARDMCKSHCFLPAAHPRESTPRAAQYIGPLLHRP